MMMIIIIIINSRTKQLHETNYIKAKIDNTYQISKCVFCGDKEETFNNIISECSKLTSKEYKLGMTVWDRESIVN